MKSLRFFLLDIGEETTPQGSEIWLWGIDDKDRNVLIVDKSFKPYFYAIPKDGSSMDTISDTLTGPSRVLGIDSGKRRRACTKMLSLI